MDFRVVAIDQRGYGESDKPEGVENYDVKLLATDVKQFIRTLGSIASILLIKYYIWEINVDYLAESAHFTPFTLQFISLANKKLEP